MPKTLVFVETKQACDLLAMAFASMNLPSMTVHGLDSPFYPPRLNFSDRPMELRQQATNKFKSGDTRIVISTDVYSRGLDIADLSIVRLDSFFNLISPLLGYQHGSSERKRTRCPRDLHPSNRTYRPKTTWNCHYFL